MHANTISTGCTGTGEEGSNGLSGSALSVSKRVASLVKVPSLIQQTTRSCPFQAGSCPFPAGHPRTPGFSLRRDRPRQKAQAELTRRGKTDEKKKESTPDH